MRAVQHNALIMFEKSCATVGGIEAKVQIDTQAHAPEVRARHVRFNLPGGIAYVVAELQPETRLRVVAA